MTTELYWLVLSILLTSLIWLPYIINRLYEQGFLKAVWDPNGDTTTNLLWAKRMMNAHINAVENLVIFAPLVIIAHLVNIHTDLTSFASMLYFFSRFAHLILFTLRVPILRIVAFFGGFIAQMLYVFSLLEMI